MKKQALLDKENQTPMEGAVAQLLIHSSKTQLAADARALRRIDGLLFKTNWKTLTVPQLLEALEIATKLEAGEDYTFNENKTKPTT